MNMRVIFSIYNVFWYLFLFFLIIRETLLRRPLLKYINPLSTQDIKKLKGKKIIWIQAVSVGETVAANTIVRELIKYFPDHQIVFTTHTPTGQAMAHKLLKDLAIITYFPLDFHVVMKRFIRLINPVMYLFFETEIWPNTIRFCKNAGAKIIMINGRISDHSYPNYLRLRFFLKHVLNLVDLFAMQSEEDAKRIKNLGANEDRIVITGNVKFDQQYPQIQPAEVQAFKQAYGWDDKLIFVAASTHRGEEETIIQTYLEIKKEMSFVLVLAPRHPERGPELEKLLRKNGLNYTKRTWQTHPTIPEVLLLDTFGELGLIYAAGDVVFVGGSLVKVGGHNVLEAAFQQKVVIYGPYMNNFRDSKILLEKIEAGLVVHNKIELLSTIKKLVNNKEFYQTRGIMAREKILTNRGASKKTIEHVFELMKQA